MGWSPGISLGAFHGFSFVFFMSCFYIIMQCLPETGYCPSLKAGQLCAIKTSSTAPGFLLLNYNEVSPGVVESYTWVLIHFNRYLMQI